MMLEKVMQLSLSLYLSDCLPMEGKPGRTGTISRTKKKEKLSHWTMMLRLQNTKLLQRPSYQCHL